MCIVWRCSCPLRCYTPFSNIANLAHFSLYLEFLNPVAVSLSLFSASCGAAVGYSPPPDRLQQAASPAAAPLTQVELQSEQMFTWLRPRLPLADPTRAYMYIVTNFCLK